MTAEEKYKMMVETPVEQLVCSLSVPTIVSMLITAVYNMADTFFVSQINTSASAAVGVSFPLMTLSQAIGFTLGSGAGNSISRLLGQKDRKSASRMAATGFITALAIGFILAVQGLVFLDKLVYALGATQTIAPYARDYIKFILIGMPFTISSFVLNNILRFQASAFYSMIGIGTGGIINIFLDPIFIFYLNLGTAGAALATIISQFISFMILYYNSNRGGNIKIKFRNFTPHWQIYREILRIGLPSFYRQALASVATICLNIAAGPFGDAAIAAMSIVGRVIHFAFSIMLGLGQGFQPVCGFNYGAKLYDRVLEAFCFCVKLSAAVLVVLAATGFIFSPRIIALFRKEDLDVIAIGTRALRFQCLTLPLCSWTVTTNMISQNIGKEKQSSILAISRQGMFFLPAVLILPRWLGVLGIQLSQPIADILSFLLSLPIGIGILRELKSLQNCESKYIHAENAFNI